MKGATQRAEAQEQAASARAADIRRGEIGPRLHA
jgi:hypothetical protein